MIYRPAESLNHYRITGYLLPALALLLLPGLAAFPWNLPLGGPLAMPFLSLLTVFFLAIRYPDLVLSPLVFASGLLTDLYTRAPMGFWTLLFLFALVCAGIASKLVDSHGKLTGWLVLPLLLGLMAGACWGLSSAYLESWQDPYLPFAGLGMGLMLLPLLMVFFIGFEKALIIKPQTR